MIRVSSLGFGAALLSCLGLFDVARAASDFLWTGAGSAAFTDAASWSGEVPAVGAVNRAKNVYILNGNARPLSYTKDHGATVFECEDFKVGAGKQPSGALKVSGGELTIISRWAPMIGHNNNSTSTLSITGGKMTIGSASNARNGERNFRVGNHRGYGTRGIVNITGGILVVDTPGDIIRGGLSVAGHEASGEINLTGGMIVVSSIHGTSLQPDDGPGVGVINFGPGDGVFMQTNSHQLRFGETQGGAESHINFLKGSRGQLSFAGARRADFEAWVRAGRIRIDGRPTTPDHFTYTDIEGQGIYQLAP